MFVATLIAAGRLTGEVVREAIDRLYVTEHSVDAPHWIDEGDAADIVFTGSLISARKELAAIGHAVDIVVQPSGHRRKRLIVADMDSTMITVECIDELADYAGLKPQIAAITARAMRGEIDFRAALAERVGLLAGLEASMLADCLAERVRLTPGARTLVETMKAHDARAVLVTGGFHAFAQPIANLIGFDHALANTLEIVDGRLTGKTVGPIIDRDAKLAALEAECKAFSILPADVLAVGDGANDIPMLTAAGLGVAYHAHPAAANAAAASIKHNDLRALLWAQGYPRAEWVVG